MKPILFYLLLLTFALLAACYPAQEPEQPTATAAVVSQVADTATPIAPTSTTLPATATATPLPTVTETATPLPTATIPPFTQGRIVFLWDERESPGVEGSEEIKPTMSLYEAVPGASPDDWIVQPLLTKFVALPQAYLSPAKSKLALLVLEDTNGDGRFTTWDDYKIHVYSFADGSAIRLNNQESMESRYSLSWLPDSQTVIYLQSSNVAAARLDGSSPELLTDNPPDPTNFIRELVGSPDGSLLALDTQSRTGRSVDFFDIQQKVINFGTEISTFDAIDLRWSPDSQWLAFTGGQNQGLSVLNVQTLAVQQLVEQPSLTFPVWSPDKSRLAFASNGKISIWDAESQTIQEVTSKDYVSEPAWSPDGSLIAAIYHEDGEAGIVIVNPSAQSEEMLNSGVSGGQVVWSPDGQWLTGLFSGQKGFGLYVVDKNTGEAHFVLDTAGYPSPSSIMWLP